MFGITNLWNFYLQVQELLQLMSEIIPSSTDYLFIWPHSSAYKLINQISSTLVTLIHVFD